jgi:hypothetical protein
MRDGKRVESADRFGTQRRGGAGFDPAPPLLLERRAPVVGHSSSGPGSAVPPITHLWIQRPRRFWQVARSTPFLMHWLYLSTHARMQRRLMDVGNPAAMNSRDADFFVLFFAAFLPADFLDEDFLVEPRLVAIGF